MYFTLIVSEMLTEVRWSALKSFDTIVLAGKGRTKFVSLKERKANRGKEKETKSAASNIENEENEEDPRLNIQTAVQDRDVKVDEIELFKGGGYERMMKAFIPENVPGPRYDIRALGSEAPTDFSRSSDDTYWSKTLELADHYAEYHQIRHGNDTSTGMLHMIIPKAMIEAAVDFKNQDHWREYVWLNSIRAEIPGTFFSGLIFLQGGSLSFKTSFVTSLPLWMSNVDHETCVGHLAYLVRAQALIGSVLDRPRERIVERHNAGDTFSILQAMKLASGQSAVQIAFKGAQIHQRLNTEARMWLEE